jgi:Ribbon-helix-helix protein, copG family
LTPQVLYDIVSYAERSVVVGRILSIRIGEKTRRAVARRARASGRSESAVVREAIEAYVGGEAGEAPYPALRDLIGIVAEGPADLSVRSGDKVRKLLRTRHTGRK